jgi:FdhE protein
MSSKPTERKAFEKKLTLLAKKQYIPEPLLQLVRQVSLRQLEAMDQARIIEPDEKRFPSADEISRGKPLLPREEFPVDLELAAALVKEFADLARGIPPLDKALETVCREMEEGSLSLEDAFTAYLSGDDRFFEAYGREKTPESPRCLNFLVQSSLAPSLMKASAALAPHLPASMAWSHGHCPLCGSLPLIGRLHSIEGHRMLTCSFCRHEYRAPRIGCPYCGEENPDCLEYFDSEDEPGVRLEVCKGCQCYIKTLDFRQLDRSCIPVLDDLWFLPFDILARQKGYSRPSLSAWGF